VQRSDAKYHASDAAVGRCWIMLPNRAL
jgi:hypothetical protein